MTENWFIQSVVIVAVQYLSCVSLWPYWLQHTRLLCLPVSPRVCSNSCPLTQWCYIILCLPVSFCLQSFPALGSFPMSWLFTSCYKSIAVSASASILSMNIPGWFILGLTGWISLLSKWLSRVFSSTTVQKHQFFGAQPSLWINSHLYMTTGKKHSFDYTDLCWQSDVSAF